MRRTSLVGLALLLALAVAPPVAAMGPPHDEASGIGCMDCHSQHGSGGVVPRGVDQETVCRTCHNPTGQAASMPNVANHEAVDCGSCHDVHEVSVTTDTHPGGITAPNLSLVRDDVALYVPGALEPAVFQQSPAHQAFDDAEPPWNGICQACHVDTDFHTNNASAEHGHNIDIDCLGCHTHSGGFEAAGGCIDCHAVAQGPRRQVADTGGDFDTTSHHVGVALDDSHCVACHYMGDHQGGVVRLKDPDAGWSTIHDWDPAAPEGVEPFCLGCHDADGALALTDPLDPFGDGVAPPDIAGSSTWADSAHNQFGFAANGGAPVSCMGDGATTGCHSNAHGTDAIKLLPGTVAATIDETCFACHTEGAVQNDSISGPTLADDIEEAFTTTSNQHDMGATFTVGGETHTLQCSSCHNPHVVTGRHWDADLGVSPVTLPDIGGANPRAMGGDLFGDIAGEKMDDYADTGVYNPPNGDADLFTGDELPDYVTFCQSCHGSLMSPSGLQVNWTNDMHGNRTAGPPSVNDCPNWFSCGKGVGWDLDNCNNDHPDCYPVRPSGRGRPMYTRPADAWEVGDGGYSPNVRNEGGNFVMSCTDCHEAHGGPYRMMRESVNGRGNNPTNWQGSNGICNACHYTWSSFHAGMSCGTASCHVSNSLHGMGAAGSSNGGYVFDEDLVLEMNFNGNLADASDFRLDGVFRVTNGSYTSGRFGSAVVVDDDPIEVGTENSYWSTDAGRHGTWKFTEMKYNMTLEAWVYPTDDTATERVVMAKHTYWDGGYAMFLEKIAGTYRASIKTNMNGGAPDFTAWDNAGCNGLRGAFSSTHVPLNRWTHIAATYDATGPDRDDTDGSVGRIRIFVNGEDVTTSYADVDTCYAQPGPGEDAMHPYSDHSPDNEAICYDGHWCASALSIGGVNWSSPSDNFIGRIDTTRIWNVTKGDAFFEGADEDAPPRLDIVEAVIGSDLLDVTFSEGVWGVDASDFTVWDTDDGRTVIGVAHTDGDAFATLTLSSPLDATDDVLVDSLEITGTVVDEYANNADDLDVIFSLSGACPTGTVTFDLNEAPGSLFVQDSSGLLYGEVSGVGALTGSELAGDGATTNVDFQYNSSCLQVSDNLTLQARFQPENIAVANYVKRVFARDATANYQMSVWRNTSWATFNPPDGVASIALWAKPVDDHGGAAWKVALTDYDLCPIVSSHWYEVTATWDSSRVGIPVEMLVDDQGTDGLGAGENWAGTLDCTDADQSQVQTDNQLWPGDTIITADGSFRIGANRNNAANNVFDGLIDWIVWSEL